MKIRVQFFDEHDMVEAGIDGGGLFKEFLEHLFKEVSAACLGHHSIREGLWFRVRGKLVPYGDSQAASSQDSWSTCSKRWVLHIWDSIHEKEGGFRRKKTTHFVFSYQVLRRAQHGGGRHK